MVQHFKTTIQNHSDLSSYYKYATFYNPSNILFWHPSVGSAGNLHPGSTIMDYSSVSCIKGLSVASTPWQPSVSLTEHFYLMQHKIESRFFCVLSSRKFNSSRRENETPCSHILTRLERQKNRSFCAHVYHVLSTKASWGQLLFC